jgi:hypothetical protein
MKISKNVTHYLSTHPVSVNHLSNSEYVSAENNLQPEIIKNNLSLRVLRPLLQLKIIWGQNLHLDL